MKPAFIQIQVASDEAAKEIKKIFSEDNGALLVLWQGTCPECKKLIKLLMVTKG